MINGLLQPVHLLLIMFLFGFGVLTVVAWWRILSKTGHPGPIGLLMWIPLLNVALLFWLAFSKWPVERRAEHLQPSNFCQNCGTAVVRS